LHWACVLHSRLSLSLSLSLSHTHTCTQLFLSEKWESGR
jgi:hypothetical protein